MSQDSEHLIWLDLEMTGLDINSDQIIEIATLITDKHLNIIAEGPVIAIHQADSVLDNMGEWCQKTHGESGLTERVRQSSFTCAQAEQQTLQFLQQHIKAGISPMCGNSIGNDRRFMQIHMPQLEAFFHYRNLDVSTIKELVKRWAPAIAEGVKKESSHLAMNDIKDSIDELRHYRQHFFLLPPE